MNDELIEAVQAVVVTSINTLGATVLGADFKAITVSPISDDEVAQIIAATVANPT